MRKFFLLAGLLSFFLCAYAWWQPLQHDLRVAMARGKKVYEQNCLSCHQADGEGVPRMNPPLIKTNYVLGDKVRLITIVLKGLNEPITIDGEEYYNPMPAQTHLTNHQVADVLTYIRNSFGNKASIVTAEEVRQVRSKLKIK